MANITIARVCILLITIISTLFMSSQARILHVERVMQKNIDSQQLLQELGFDLSKLANLQRRSLEVPSGDQVVPGGPDHQHHKP
jgi:hypothetical protein